ncbi:MAG: hypothetical protein AAF456_23485 [Planctomycetota bacterium]
MNEIIARRFSYSGLCIGRSLSVVICVISLMACANVQATVQLTPIEQSADDLPYNSGLMIVILSNGHAIEGELLSEDGKVILVTAQGSRLVMPREEISFACETYDDAYWNKLARIRASDLEGQIELFRWCMRYELHKQAANQIDIISQMRLPASRLENLHRQLFIAQQAEQQNNPPELADSAIAQNNSGHSANEFDIRSLPPMNELASGGRFRPGSTSGTGRLAGPPADMMIDGVPGEVRQVGFVEDVRVPPGTITLTSEPGVEIPDTVEPESAVYRPSTDELDDLTKSLGGDAVAFYKRRVEPVLVRSCFTAGCHNSGADAMPLQRVSRHSSIPRRMSQRNLYNIIRYADPNRPLSSILLSNAATPHGETGERHNGEFLDRNSKQFENLAIWLIMVSNDPNGNHQMPMPDDMTAPAMERAALEQAAVLPAPPGAQPLVQPYTENSPLDAAANFDAEFGSGVGLMDGVTLSSESGLSLPVIEQPVIEQMENGQASPANVPAAAPVGNDNPHSADIFNQQHRGG